MRPHRVIRAAVDRPLAGASDRRRAVGPIGGLVGRSDPAALARLAAALGPGAQLLAAGQPAGSLIVDWDCCWLDDRPIRGLDDWAAPARGSDWRPWTGHSPWPG
jgi:hypothetical protein